MGTRRPQRAWTASQKFEIVLAGMRGDRTVVEICREHEIDPTAYYRWRERMLEGAKIALGGTGDHAELAETHKRIRQLERSLGKKALESRSWGKRRGADLRDLLNTADLVAPDGMPLVWLQRASGRTCERVCGPDLMLALLDRGRATGARHFFYGGAEGVAGELARRMAGRYPGLRVAGTESPPFRPLSPEEDAAAVDRINAAAPDFVWVGLGSPQQELWLASHRDRLAAPVLLAVGAAFDFHAGRRPRAPELMQRTGTEWLFRFATEPRRLGRRYVVTNAQFLGLLAAARFRRLRTRRCQR
jgi:N-acetylglucosaminyldiphosphoundecaprenol N-acetyl-beta-D-mannosaminyltransferase